MHCHAQEHTKEALIFRENAALSKGNHQNHQGPERTKIFQGHHPVTWVGLVEYPARGSYRG